MWDKHGHASTGRKPKFQPGDIAELKGTADAQWGARWGVVVARRADKARRGEYLVVRCLTNGTQRQGKSVWVPSWALSKTGLRSMRGLRVWRANAKIKDRGCRCQCCVHRPMDRTNG